VVEKRLRITLTVLKRLRSILLEQQEEFQFSGVDLRTSHNFRAELVKDILDEIRRLEANEQRVRDVSLKMMMNEVIFIFKEQTTLNCLNFGVRASHWIKRRVLTNFTMEERSKVFEILTLENSNPNSRFQQQENLRRVGLRKIPPKMVTGLGERLRVKSATFDMNLEWTPIGREGVEVVAEALKINQTLIKLNLVSCEIGAEGARALAEALKINGSLTQLDVSNNEIGNEGAKALAELLKVNGTVAQLGLRDNKIGIEGSKALAETLKFNNTLTQLDLQGNEFGAEGLNALAETLKMNETVTNLYLGWKWFDEENKSNLVCF